MKFSLTCVEFRPLKRNTLHGFVVISIAALKLEIKDIALHEKAERRWAQLPARPQVRNGALVRSDDGKIVGGG